MNSDLTDRAIALLRGNDAGGFTKPSPTQYPHLWNWDSAVIALGLSHFDMARAWQEVRTLLSAQWRDGMLPHIVYPHGASDYFPSPEFWRTQGLARAGAVPSSGLTQPPILATVVRALIERTARSDSALADACAREVAPKIMAWHRWLHTARDADGTGLPCLIHPWESGTDNSPRWLAAMDRIEPSDLPPYVRRDTAHVAADERPRPQDYERFVHLIDVGRRLAWEPRELVARMPFLVQDAMFCAILHRADEDLREIVMGLGLPTDELDAWIAGTRRTFASRFWDEHQGLYLDFDVRSQAPIRVSTIATFMPMFAGLPTAQQAERLVREHLRNPDEYAAGKGCACELTSTSKSEPMFAPRRYWCGPVWVIANWLVAQGLRRYGYAADADRLDLQNIALMAQSGFREYYDPRDGSGCGATSFSWSAAFLLELTQAT